MVALEKHSHVPKWRSALFTMANRHLTRPLAERSFNPKVAERALASAERIPQEQVAQIAQRIGLFYEIDSEQIAQAAQTPAYIYNREQKMQEELLYLYQNLRQERVADRNKSLKNRRVMKSGTKRFWQAVKDYTKEYRTFPEFERDLANIFSHKRQDIEEEGGSFEATPKPKIIILNEEIDKFQNILDHEVYHALTYFPPTSPQTYDATIGFSHKGSSKFSNMLTEACTEVLRIAEAHPDLSTLDLYTLISDDYAFFTHCKN